MCKPDFFLSKGTLNWILLLFFIHISIVTYAVTIELDNGVILSIPLPKEKTLDKYSFSNTSLEPDGTKQNFYLHTHDSLGYMQLIPGKRQAPGWGTLYISIASVQKPSDTAHAPKTIGVKFAERRKIPYDPPVMASTEVTLTQIMGDRIVGVPRDCGPGEICTFLEQTDKSPSLQIQNGQVFSIMIPSVYYEDINFQQPTLIVNGKEYQMNHEALPDSLPDANTVIIMYFVPDKGKDEGEDEDEDVPVELHIHMTTPLPKAAETITDSRELTTADIQDLADRLHIGDIAVLIRTTAWLDEAAISTIKNQYPTNLYEAGFQLLSRVLDKLGSSLTLEVMAKGLEKIDHRNIAKKLRSGELKLSSEDEEFQKEMTSVGDWLDSHAEALAARMGMSEKAINDIKQDTKQPGYRLLYLAHEADKLSGVYEACNNMNLIALRGQVEGGEFPLLAIQLAKQATPRDVSKPKLRPVSLDGLNADLLRVKVDKFRANRVASRIISKEEREGFGKKIQTTMGDNDTVNQHSWESLTGYRTQISSYHSDKWGKGLTYGKFIEILNKTETLQGVSLAQYIAEQIRNGDVEKSLESEDYVHLAKLCKDSDYGRCLLILNRMKVEDELGILRADLIHSFGIKCNQGSNSGCTNKKLSSGVLVRKCDDMLNLEDEMARMKVSGVAKFPSTAKH
ncbi:death domain-containing protein [Sansalvadorimonas sp. 2012CJ34-2]|uniref:Death domain-containing protein n=1 Tax=Parendozoicomonas callyspongiae TaxID=2942213 RepID=A0ABT0PJ38_9GAMM|nr:death domain-containing protein [Sansalvadorimonas sp. 2012CJ34-2]MCL6271380.1 death domain-containing protein [Sansalvadorimonas sp. 2012CJ34-2]